MDRQKFLKFYKGDTNAELAFILLSDALTQLGIYSPLTITGALATVRVECGRSFKPVVEIASGQAYEGRKDLGNVNPGDGVKYKGRGYIQLTGRSNYDHYGKAIGYDLINNPELVLEPLISSKILALYFKERGVNLACDNQDWTKVRKLINGGSNGLDIFISIINQYKA